MTTEPRPPCSDVIHRAQLHVLIDFRAFWVATGSGDAHEALAAFRAAEDVKYEGMLA
jgi:hypothetical protein